jgi:hypothetical protein
MHDFVDDDAVALAIASVEVAFELVATAFDDGVAFVALLCSVGGKALEGVESPDLTTVDFVRTAARAFGEAVFADGAFGGLVPDEAPFCRPPFWTFLFFSSVTVLGNCS